MLYKLTNSVFQDLPIYKQREAVFRFHLSFFKMLKALLVCMKLV